MGEGLGAFTGTFGSLDMWMPGAGVKLPPEQSPEGVWRLHILEYVQSHHVAKPHF